MRKIYHKINVQKKRNWAISIEKENMKGLRMSPLSDEEKDLLFKTWHRLGLRINPLYYQMFKTIVGFNSEYLSDDLFFPMIIKTLNPDNIVGALEHKGLYSTIYKNLPQPVILVQRINGVDYDSMMNIVNLNSVIKDTSLQKHYIIKPTVGSCMGRGVRKIFFDKNSQMDIDNIICDYGDNFVIQEVVEQSAQTAVFNEGSLNTFRVSTLNINGIVSLCTIIFRCGRNNSCVDNGGAGGLIVGVKEDGQFYEFAYDTHYNKYSQTSGGVKFGETKIEEVKDLVELAVNAHRIYLPACGFAGWDLALDMNNKPVFIEVNLGFPGIQFEQLCPATPIFKGRTQEVIEYVRKHQNLI